jgi:predicted permease
MREVSLIENLIQDLRYGLRMLAKRPAFTAAAVLVLALGIGANTAMFSVVEAVLLKPLPYQHPDRLTVIWQADAQHRATGAVFDPYREFETWQRYSHSFEKLAAATWANTGETLLWRGDRREVLSIPVSVDFFSVLGVQASQGRTFTRADLTNPCTVVLAYGLWQSRLGGTPGLVGRSLTLGDKDCIVIGIMPKDFSFYPKQTELWTLITPASAYAKQPWDSVVGVFGLLKPGVSREGAEAELAVLQKGIMGEAPAYWVRLNFSPVVLDLQQEFTWLTGRNLRTSLIVLFGAVVFILLIACVNVANLLLGRASERQREMGIRAALGSGRARLMRQLLTESVLLAGCGSALGSLLAFAGIRYLRTANPVDLPPGNLVSLNGQVLAFTALVTVLTGLLFGLVPAWKASRLDLNEVLKASSAAIAGTLSRRAGKILVVAEVALSLVLLAGAGLLIESVDRLGSAPLGFEPDHLLVERLALPEATYSKPEQRTRFYDRLTLDLGAVPGVRGVALSPRFGNGYNPLAIEGRPSPASTSPNVNEQSVSAGYFQVMGIRLLRGREFDTRDREQTLPVAVVNQALTRKYFPNEDPVGRQIKLGKAEDNKPWLTIVGVADDVKSTTVFNEMGYVEDPCVYRPLKQDPAAPVSIYLRTASNPLLLASSVRREISDLDSNLAPADPQTMNEWLAQFRSQPRLRAIVLAVFAGLALLLTAIGIYAVLSQSVLQRTHEIGVRMAMGAERRDVLSLIVGRGVVLVLAGVGIGVAAGLALARLIAGLLYGVAPADPTTFVAVSLLLTAVALCSSYIPARRASKVDPMVALRHE